jgi:hypothetical protein
MLILPKSQQLFVHSHKVQIRPPKEAFESSMISLNRRCHSNTKMKALIYPDLHKLLFPQNKPSILTVFNGFQQITFAKAVKFYPIIAPSSTG